MASRPCGQVVRRWFSACCTYYDGYSAPDHIVASVASIRVHDNPFHSVWHSNHFCSPIRRLAPSVFDAWQWLDSEQVVPRALVASVLGTVAIAGRSCPRCNSRQSLEAPHVHTARYFGTFWRGNQRENTSGYQLRDIIDTTKHTYL